MYLLLQRCLLRVLLVIFVADCAASDFISLGDYRTDDAGSRLLDMSADGNSLAVVSYGELHLDCQNSPAFGSSILDPISVKQIDIDVTLWTPTEGHSFIRHTDGSMDDAFLNGNGTRIVGRSGFFSSSRYAGCGIELHTVQTPEYWSWTQGERTEQLAHNPSVGWYGPDLAIKGLSDDGNATFGATVQPLGYRRGQAFVHTAANGVELLGYLGETSESGPYSIANGISPDGSIVVGESTIARMVERSVCSTNGCTEVMSPGHEAFRWTEGGGMEGLGHLPGGHRSKASGISGDGNVIFGTSDDGDGNYQMFRWTEPQGMQPIGIGSPVDANHDGSVIVGQHIVGEFAPITDISSIGFRAMVWDAKHGSRDLLAVLESDYGMELDGWHLTDARAISNDGLTIAGNGVNPAGEIEAWVVQLDRAMVPEPNGTQLLGFGLVSLFVLATRNKNQLRSSSSRSLSLESIPSSRN